MSSKSDWLAKVQQDSLARLEAVDDMQRQLQGLTGRAEVPDSSVSVAVTPTGALTELHISEQAMSRLTGDQLARTIRSLCDQATAGVTARVHEIVGHVVPTADLDAMLQGTVPPSTREAVRDELRQRREGGL